MTAQQRKLADIFFRVGCIQFGEFRLKLHDTKPDAPLSPFYINFRLLQSFPRDIKAIAKNLAIYTKDLDFDLIAAIPLAATPLGEALSLTTDKPLITPRPPKSHGIDSGVDGVYTKGQTALLLDDLITKGDSKFTPIDTMRKKGLVVNDILVLVDREQGGREELKKYKVKLHAIMTFSELFAYYKKSGKIDSATFTRVTSYINHS